MGQKVDPRGIRLGIVKKHNSIWHAERLDYVRNLKLDFEVRQFLNAQLKDAFVSKIDISRAPQKVMITIHTARPGIVIGKKGEGADSLRQKLKKILGIDVIVNVDEIKQPDLDATLLARSVCEQLERRVQFRRAMKRAMQNCLRSGAEGVKIMVSGRLGGAEIARSEWSREGRVPLHTLRADIDYAAEEAHTTYGVIGVKVWICKGEIIGGRRTTKQSKF